MEINLLFEKLGRIGSLSILLFLVYFSASAQCGCTDCRCSDSLELVKLYNSTNGANWTNKWVLSQPMTTWYGVTLTNDQVTIIALSSNSLVGTIPNFNLPNLQYLYLNYNQLSGNIPNFNLPNLQVLDLYGNQLSGNIPNFNLPNLDLLGLSDNQLSGNIPNFNLPKLLWLHSYNNQLSGSIPNFNLPNLQKLGLSSNQLSGTIPNFNLSNLQHLELSDNQLSGTIPNFNLSNLQRLYLSENQLSGSVPNFQNLTSLRQLYLNINNITGCFPTEWRRFCSFQFSTHLDSSYNFTSNPKLAWQGDFQRFCNNEPQIGASCNDSLTTTINDKIQADCSCKGTLLTDTTTCRYKDSLQLVNLYNATGGTNWTHQWNFNQPITTWYGIRTNTEGCVTFIDLDGNADFSYSGSPGAGGNNLTGQLPTLTFPELLDMYLDNNHLSGTLPALNLPKIIILGIAHNPLIKGTIPTSWNFPDLEYLGLCCDGLDGVLPTLSFPKLIGIYLQNNKLTGALPVLNLPSIQQIDFGTNNFSNCFPAAYRALCPISFHNFFNNPLLPNNGNFDEFCTNNSGICDNTNNCRHQDSLQLVALYNATNGANWTNKTNWLSSRPINEWFGISTNTEGCVGIIDLKNNQLKGSLPNLSFANLKILSLGYNQLSGAIPNFNMPLLETLSLSLNQLTGTIPNFNMPNLTKLDLAGNKISGSLPNFNMPLLQYLYLNDNQLTGNIPSFNMPKLIEFILSNNKLDGTISNFNMPLLTRFYLDRNQLSGNIPNFNMPVLVELSLYANNLSGTIPNFSMPQLVLMWLGFNQLTGNIPNFTMPLLKDLNLNNNQLSGNIPNFALPKLDSLSLCCNQLSGTLPNFNLPNLKKLYIPFNQLSGALPSLQNLTQLFELKINNNQFSGCFPTEWRRFCTVSYSCGGNVQLPWQGDFQRFCNNEAQIGASCDDNLATTVNDKIQADCSCKGMILVDTTTCRYKDSLVLVKLFQSTNGANWRIRNVNGHKSPWVLTEPMDNWLGVFFNPQNCVAQISLNDNNLSGTLPTELGQIANLNYLGLSNNQIGGAIPASLGNLPLLTHFDLSFNRFDSLIPPSLGNLRQVKYFYLGGNLLRGAIPPSLGNLTQAIEFMLNENQLTGDIPSTLGNLTNVELLLLSQNSLSGSIPASFLNLRNLKSLQLYENQLTGNIPNFSLPNLEYFSVSTNKLTGSIPNFNTPKLLLFSAYDNQLTDTIPNFNAPNMYLLDLNTNNLTGKIPNFNMPKLERLVLNNNQLSGTIPTCDNLKKLFTFDFYNNKIDSLPNISTLPFLKDTTTLLRGLRSQNNQLTFDDILPNINLLGRATYIYAPQNPIFKDTTINTTIGSTVTVDLKIDGAIADNNYRWFKNGVEIPSLFSQKNKFILRGVIACDAGTYTCQVTNSRAPLLTLYSRNIVVNVPSLVPTTRNKTICAGQKDTLPSGRIVSPTVTTTYRDTVKSRVNLSCDSAIFVNNLTVLNAQTVSKIDSFCNGKTYILPQTNRSVSAAGTYRDTIVSMGCQAIYITTLTYRTEQTQTVNITLCKGQTYTLPDARVVNTEGSFISRKNSSTSCDSVITTILRFLATPDAFDDDIELNTGDSVSLNLLLNDKLNGQNGRITLLNLPTEGTTKRLNDTQIRYTAPQILRGSNMQTLDYKVCLIDCPSNCDSAILHIKINDNNTPIGRVKNGVAPELSGEEYFEIDSIQAFTQAQLFIYNNWNELVFKSAVPYDNRWKGTGQNDAPLPSGVYYYVLRHIAPNRKYLEGKILLLHD